MRTRSAAIAMSVLLVAGCSVSLGGAPDLGAPRSAAISAKPAGHPTVRWAPCGGSLQCATLRVPLAWANPSGPSIGLALYRWPSTGRRIGALLSNPGGPGASGRILAAQAPSIFSARLRAHFDIVSWDPRGTGASTALGCGDRLDDFFAVDRSPDTPSEVTANERVARALATECARHDGALLAHVSTTETVGDIDAIRQALGEARITYLGFSYGTYLGTRYAARFPNRVRALVLDGPVDPSIDARTSSIDQAVGFEHDLDAFLAACGHDTACAFHRVDEQGAFARVERTVETQSLRTTVDGESRSLSPSEFDLAVGSVLYAGRSGWSDLATALDDLSRGDAAAAVRLADSYTDRRRGGHYGSEQAAFYAISCADGQGFTTTSQLIAAAHDAAVQAPFFGADNVWLGAPCAYWPVSPDTHPAPVRIAPTAPTPVVLATTADPATPYRWGIALAAQLHARLVTVEGSAHTAYASGNECVDRLVDAYLIDGAVPPVGARC